MFSCSFVFFLILLGSGELICFIFKRQVLFFLLLERVPSVLEFAVQQIPFFSNWMLFSNTWLFYTGFSIINRLCSLWFPLTSRHIPFPQSEHFFILTLWSWESTVVSVAMWVGQVPDGRLVDIYGFPPEWIWIESGNGNEWVLTYGKPYRRIFLRQALFSEIVIL